MPPTRPARRATASLTSQYRADCRDCSFVSDWFTHEDDADRQAIIHQKETDYTHEVDVYAVVIRTRIRAARNLK
jgi:hypothetical protein